MALIFSTSAAGSMRPGASCVQQTSIKAPIFAACWRASSGAAIIAPVSAFPGGVPANALIVLPLSQPTEELTTSLKKGPVVGRNGVSRVTVTLAPGRYTYLCTVGKHAKNGMTGTLTVTR